MTGSSPTTVLITGMHRSGTSLLARRADLGRAQHLGLELTKLADDLRTESDALRLRLSETWSDLAATLGDPGRTASASHR